MIQYAQATLRNLGLLFYQRGLYLVGVTLFAALIPRMMGPSRFGQFALVTSLALWFATFSQMGFSSIIGRYVPLFILRGDRESLGKLLGNLLTLRLAAGFLTAGGYLFLTRLWLREIELPVLVLLAGTILVRTWSQLFFSVFLGLNQAARASAGEIMRRWLSLLFLIPGFYLGDLPGACLGLLVTELLLLAISACWVRPHLREARWGLDLAMMAPYLGFGLIFFASNLVGAALNYSGDTLVRAVLGDYAQVSYFRLAHNVYFALSFVIPQFTFAFAPLLANLLEQRETEALRDWVERLIKWLAAGGVVAFFGVLLLGEDLVPLVLGGAYRSVVANLLPLMLMLLSLTLISVGNLLALTYNRPGVALATSTLNLAAFWAFGLPAVAWWGSWGGCLAMLAASMLAAGFSTYRMRQATPYSLKAFWWVLGTGGLLFPLYWLRSSWPMNTALFLGFMLAYGGLLLCLRVMTLGEVAALWRTLSTRPG